MPNNTEETRDPDFQMVLKELLAAYRPILEAELEKSKQPDKLVEEENARPPDCNDELALGNKILDSFWNEKVADRVLPEEARALLGPIERWRWCFLHARCCILFGWLVCRGPRTFRAFVYYLYRYWLCIRRGQGRVSEQGALTAEEMKDFQTLIQSFAAAYRPYLTDQLATVEFTQGLAEDIVAGKVDCFEGQEEAAAIFERFLTVETAPALLGREAFAAHSKDPFFWFCRCWCLCSIRFGCCLARARTFRDVVHCLRLYRRCLKECLQPLTCEIIRPAANACADEQYFAGPDVLGVQIAGTATGAGCDHYILDWKPAGAPDSAYSTAGIVYAGPAGLTQGICGKVATTLGYLSTAATSVPDSVTLRLCVYGSPAVAPCCRTVDFQIFRQRVWIGAVEGVMVASPGPLGGLAGANAQLQSGTVVRSFGYALQLFGRAWVGKCAGREVKRYTLSYQSGFVTDHSMGVWTQFWQVDYQTALQRKEIQTVDFALTSSWGYQPICLGSPPCAMPSPPACCIPKDVLWPTRWFSGRSVPSVPVGPQSYPVDPEVPAVVWTSQQLPLGPGGNCQSGRFTLLLDVEDTAGNHYYDTQQIWIDNKEIHGKITQVAGVEACSTLYLSKFAPPGAGCKDPWKADLLGIAFDELIEEGNFAVPSDNYAMVGGVVQGGFRLWIKKDGAPDPGHILPIPGPVVPPLPPPDPYLGSTRVGDPGTRCASASPALAVIPPESHNVLTTLDMRRLDAVCNPAEPDLTLKRGECCGYVITLHVFDNSICPWLSGGHHEIYHHFPVCICNDLPPVTG
ncbi:MAG: hypothetical protein HY822_21645 [Acidobacteria bacterium]|nr:hypothetical protein [Acidobacteriota bacterium]